MNLESNLGFSKNPFSKKSSEQEIDFLDEIFYTPNFYDTLTDDLSNGDSRFIIGQRGHGKSSIINKLFEDLNNKGCFVLKIDRFDDIPLKKNETAFIRLILKHIITKFCLDLFKNKRKLKKLDIIDKDKLCSFQRIFYGGLNDNEYSKIYDSIKKIETKNFLIKLFNNFGISFVNNVANSVTMFTSSTIRDSLGLEKGNSDYIHKKYFQEIKLIEFQKLDAEKISFKKTELKLILDEVLKIVEKVGYSKTVILFDKIDEVQDLNQDIDQIVSFTKEILTDTELLMNENIAIGFSLWSELKFALSGKVRFDKFGTIDVRWNSADLEPLIDLRLLHFSVKKPISFSDLIPNKNFRNDIVRVANKSPRDLISCLAEIYLVQSNTNKESNFFEDESISKGLISFCRDFDYESLFPARIKKNTEIRAMIQRLLAVKLLRFSLKDLQETFKQSVGQSEGQVKVMMGYKLIEEDDILGTNGQKFYEVIDPKVEYLIKRAITNL